MVIQRVKLKFPASALLILPALATFLLSFAGGFPEEWVERRFAKGVFPTISHIAAPLADSVRFSLLDPVLVGVLAIFIYTISRRRWSTALGLVAALYLWFFWTWGLNYHRVPLEVRLGIDPSQVSSQQTDGFAQVAAMELNRLYDESSSRAGPPALIGRHASDRVRLVVSKIDGKDLRAATVVKSSLIAQGWFRIAGIDGMFNPFGHEPLITGGLLGIELPFVMSHELAHVRGLADEGDANLVALLATVASQDRAFQYSGWLYLWLHLATRERNAWLAPGPAADLRAVYDRMQSQRIEWASDVQSAVLDLHLKTNDVDEGLASYSRVVAMAIASQDRWGDYR